MSKARLFLACLACVLIAMNAAAGPSSPVRNPKGSHSAYGSDFLWQWFNAMRSVKVRLAQMVGGSRGRVVYETSEMLSENPSSMCCFRVCMEGKFTGLSEGIPDTLITDSLAAALSGDGRGESKKRPLGEGDLHPSFLLDRNP